MEETDYSSSGDIRIRTLDNIVKEDPCPDCGRTYTVRESVSVRLNYQKAPSWEGCVDCWVKRTTPKPNPGEFPWRVGTKVGRTIYDVNDVLIGVMDTPELATRVVEAVNGTD